MKGKESADLSALHESQMLYVKRIEKENFERVVKLKRMRKNSIITGLSLAGTVVGICILFMSETLRFYSVNQPFYLFIFFFFIIVIKLKTVII